MDHYVDELAALTECLNLNDAVHIGHSTGGGKVIHYIERHGESRVAKAAIISAVPPLIYHSGPSRRPVLGLWKSRSDCGKLKARI
jgi:non-heme chloroperoxidase